ncbi:MAG TPA: hypothetical protein VMW63_05150 [Methanoregulaceae archaeon]|nr:hypothetical protein [Methanoregulaceae archaeon]
MNRIFRYTIFFILLIFPVLIAGCSIQESSGGETARGPIKEIPISAEDLPETIRFQNALVILQSINLTGTASQVPIHYIRGENLSADGSASIWIFGVKQDGNNYFVAISSKDQVLTPWRAWLPMDAIQISRITTPDRLLQTNYQQIYETFGVEDTVRIEELELANGIYTLRSGISGEEQVLLFDAGSGRRIL